MLERRIKTLKNILKREHKIRDTCVKFCLSSLVWRYSKRIRNVPKYKLSQYLQYHSTFDLPNVVNTNTKQQTKKKKQTKTGLLWSQPN